MARKIHGHNKVALEEQLPVRIRVGRFKGLTGKVQYIQRSTGHPRVYVWIKPTVGSWIAPRSLEVIR